MSVYANAAVQRIIRLISKDSCGAISSQKTLTCSRLFTPKASIYFSDEEACSVFGTQLAHIKSRKKNPAAVLETTDEHQC